jgi:hypothetical protein
MQLIRYERWTGLLRETDIFSIIDDELFSPFKPYMSANSYHEICSSIVTSQNIFQEDFIPEQDMEHWASKGAILAQIRMYEKTKSLFWAGALCEQEVNIGTYAYVDDCARYRQHIETVRESMMWFSLCMKKKRRWMPKDIEKMVCRYIWRTRYDDKWDRRQSERLKESKRRKK